MALNLRSSKDIKGITVKLDEKNHSIKISQLADDTTLFCNSKEDVLKAMNEIEIFGSFSGLLLNRNKTEGVWIGKLNNCKYKIAGINWADKPIKNLNRENKIEKMNKLFCAWGKRNLSILGKKIFIKSLILPLFTFLASVCLVPDIYHKEIEKKCFKFIWYGKPDKVKRNLIINSYERGGLQMIDIKSYFIALKASWVSRLVTGHISNWKLIPLKYFNATGKNWLVFSMNLDSTKSLNYLKKIPEFYREVFICLNLSGDGQTNSPVTFIDIRKQIIWGNKHITFENKPVVFENWIKSDLIYVNDILDATKTLSSKFILENLKLKSNWIAEFNIVKKSI